MIERRVRKPKMFWYERFVARSYFGVVTMIAPKFHSTSKQHRMKNPLLALNIEKLVTANTKIPDELVRLRGVNRLDLSHGSTIISTRG